MTARRAMTLLEIVAALAVLALLVPAAGSWLVGASRSAAELRETLERETRARRALDLIEADLDAADPASVSVDANSLSLRTSSALGGETPAWGAVVWRIEDGALVRARQGDDQSSLRSVLDGVEVLRIERVESETEGTTTLAAVVVRLTLRDGPTRTLAWRPPR